MTAALSQWKIFLQFMANLCDGNTGNRCNLSSDIFMHVYHWHWLVMSGAMLLQTGY